MNSLPSSNDKISICMATYNGERFLVQQVDSILEQMREGDELIVSDDCSTDETASILRGYGDSLKIVADTRAGGVVANFSRVLQCAKNSFIVLADQDDVWLPERLTRMREHLSKADLVLTNAWVVDGDLCAIGTTLFEETGASPGFWRNLTRRNSFVGCCMGFRRSLLYKALPFPPATPWHDWLLGLLASIGGRVYLDSTPLLLYRRHGSNASQTGQVSTNSLWKMIKLRIKIFVSLSICLCRWNVRRLRHTSPEVSP